jgi:S-adenosylmethionine decarboxylase
MNKPIPRLSKHYIATLVTKTPDLLRDMESCCDAISKVLEEQKISCIGDLSHEFHNKSFTLVYALAESHISIHTWPERHVVQLDVFLCNYMNDNSEKAQAIFDTIVAHFKPSEITETVVDRL